MGSPDYKASLKREELIVSWLDTIKKDAAEIYLVGDIFDFWFEYQYVVPKGYIRFLSKLIELVNQGVSVHIFTGNHDLWYKNYLPQEMGVMIHKYPVIKRIYGKEFYIAHGDGHGPGDYKYKIIKKVFTNPLAQWLFKWLHPDIGYKIAYTWSRHSRKSNGNPKFFEEKEFIIQFCNKYVKQTNTNIHYFIFGHRHIPCKYKLTENAECIYLGDWINNYTYAVFDGNDIKVEKYIPSKK